MAQNSSSTSQSQQGITISTDQRQNYEQFRNLICEHIRERFGTMGKQVTGNEVAEWLRSQSLDQLSRPAQQREEQKAGGKS